MTPSTAVSGPRLTHAFSGSKQAQRRLRPGTSALLSGRTAVFGHGQESYLDARRLLLSYGTRPTLGVKGRDHCVWIVSDMPKTRSGKIMRRVIASISNFADVGDVTTLANPELVDDIRHQVQSEKVAHGEAPGELTAEEEESIKAFGQAE